MCCIGLAGTNEQKSDMSFLEGKTLEDLCDMFGLVGENCSCAFLDGLCEFITTSGNVTNGSIFVCENSSNIVLASVNVFAAVVGIVGNGIVVIVNIRFWKQTNRCRNLFTGLATADFIFAIILFIINLPLLWTCTWPYGLAMCKLLRSFLNASALVALGFIVIIAVERYVGTVYPMNISFTATKLYIMIFMNYILGFAMVVPSIVVLEMGRYNTCRENWSGNGSVIYSWILLTFYFLLPIAFISVLYFVIMSTVNKSVSDNTGIVDDSHVKKRMKENQRVMVILLTVLIAFFVLVLPNRLVWVIVDHIGVNNLSKSTYRGLKLFALIPYSFHAAINPIIYSVVDHKFRKNVFSMFGISMVGRKFSAIENNTTQTSRVNEGFRLSTF